MSDRLLVCAVGAVIEIDASARGSAFSERVVAAWADARYEGDRDPDDVVTVSGEFDDATALSMLSTDVTVAALARRRHDPIWMLHAAGLSDADGRVLVLSAASGTGKTTAAKHLSRRFGYVSDETVGIEADGRVVAYRKPLSIIEDASAPKAQVALSSLDGGRALPPELHVAKVVVIDRSPDGPVPPELDQLDLAEALELLGPQTSYLCDGAAPLHRVAAVLAATGGAVRLRYREIAHVDALVDDLLSADVPALETSTRPVVVAADGSGADGYVRTDVVDALRFDHRLALLQRTPSGGQIDVLDGIGPAVWAAASGRTLAEITEAVVAEHGAPPDADAGALVAEAIERLVADGLLRRATGQT